jgi:uncharacterized protein YbjT (DUF2867 family)
MILVTGAAGKTGRAVIRALVERGQAVRALVRREQDVGAQETVVASMADEAVFVRAARGVDAIYHICPNASPDEIAFGRNAIAAARAAGVARFAYHSVLHPQIEAMPHHWHKMRVEELLFASGLDVTILQPTAYMQNLLANWPAIRQGVHRTPYPVTSRISLVDLGDVAEVAARVLTGGGHSAATYELVGTPPLSQGEVADVLSEALDRPVRAESESIEQWRARAAGLGHRQADVLTRMFQYYARHGLGGNDRALRGLLGRPPTSLLEFARRVQG